jgi:hypothetical protein
MTPDIVLTAEIAATPLAVRRALLDAAEHDGGRARLHLGDAQLRLQGQDAEVGVRGKASWLGTPFRVTVHLVPSGEGTRLLMSALELHPGETRGLRRLLARRRAGRDLQRLVTVARRALDAPAAPADPALPAAR